MHKHEIAYSCNLIELYSRSCYSKCKRMFFLFNRKGAIKMKRFSRNLLAVILAVLLLASALPLTAFAAEEKPTPTSGPTENVFISRTAP